MSENQKISIYYDGLCHLCSREMDHYKKQKGHENFIFVDITSNHFNPESEGLNPKAVHKVMHVKDKEGNIRTDVEAFILIWENLPNYVWMSRFAKNSFLKIFLKIGYHGFAFLRPYLPKKKSNCDQSPYCDVKTKK